MNRTLRWMVAAMAPIPAILIGILVMSLHGVSTTAMFVQSAALAVGLVLFAAVSRVNAMRASTFVLIAFIAALLVTLFFVGLEGVHRWISLGPIRLHVSMLLAPVALASMAAWLARGQTAAAMAIAIAAQFIHLLQPDAAAASAFAAGSVALFVGTYLRPSSGVGHRAIPLLVILIIMLSLAIWVWRRPDPLLPVAHVEGIIELAIMKGFALHASAIVSLALVPLATIGVAWKQTNHPAALNAACAIAVYFVATTIATRFGAFPVPLMGFGASSILGMYLGLGWVVAMMRRTSVD